MTDCSKIPSIFDDPHDGTVLVQIERPPNFMRMTPEQLADFQRVNRPLYVRRLAAQLDAACDDTLALVKAQMTRDLLK